MDGSSSLGSFLQSVPPPSPDISPVFYGVQVRSFDEDCELGVGPVPRAEPVCNFSGLLKFFLSSSRVGGSPKLAINHTRHQTLKFSNRGAHKDYTSVPILGGQVDIGLKTIGVGSLPSVVLHS